MIGDTKTRPTPVIKEEKETIESDQGEKEADIRSK